MSFSRDFVVENFGPSTTIDGHVTGYFQEGFRREGA
jgi:hypothetical protein